MTESNPRLQLGKSIYAVQGGPCAFAARVDLRELVLRCPHMSASEARSRDTVVTSAGGNDLLDANEVISGFRDDDGALAPFESPSHAV
jgi:hypothetical protein